MRQACEAGPWPLQGLPGLPALHAQLHLACGPCRAARDEPASRHVATLHPSPVTTPRARARDRARARSPRALPRSRRGVRGCDRGRALGLGTTRARAAARPRTPSSCPGAQGEARGAPGPSRRRARLEGHGGPERARGGTAACTRHGRVSITWTRGRDGCSLAGRGGCIARTPRRPRKGGPRVLEAPQTRHRLPPRPAVYRATVRRPRAPPPCRGRCLRRSKTPRAHKTMSWTYQSRHRTQSTYQSRDTRCCSQIRDTWHVTCSAQPNESCRASTMWYLQAIPCSASHTMLSQPCHAQPAMRCSASHAMLCATSRTVRLIRLSATRRASPRKP